MSKTQDLLNDLASLKETFESMTVYSVFPVMLVPRNLYNAIWDDLKRDGFLDETQHATRRGEDINLFTFKIRLMPDKVSL